MAMVSEDLTVIGRFISDYWGNYKKARLPLLMSLVLGIQILFETDDLRVLEISEKCSRFTKYIGC